MRAISDDLQTHLDSGVTTLCWCWRVTRRDGVVLGFTDHDRELSFDGTAFEAASGFTATEIRQSIGLNVDNLDVESALSSQSLNEEDLLAGLFDDARVEIYRVNWQDPVQRVLARAGSIGEVKYGQSVFTAEIRGLAHYLQQENGRLYQYRCDADLGDGRCGVSLSAPGFTAYGTVNSVVSKRQFAAAGLGAYSAGWFAQGLVTWTAGNNVGRAMEVKLHQASAGSVMLELWQPMASDIVDGDAFAVTVGCDKQIETCRSKFSNTINFRGFPHMPGNDALISYPSSDDTFSG